VSESLPAAETSVPPAASAVPATPEAPAARPGYEERLWVPPWWAVPALGVSGLLAAEVHMGYPGVRAWLPYVLLLTVAAAVLLTLSRTRVRVTAERLEVGPASLPLEFVGEVDVVPKAGKRRALGPESDPAAFMLHRAWIGPMVRVRLTDPDDLTPYWIFSTRRPDRLVELLGSRTGRADDVT
jgi:hypothetical protein